MRSTLVACSLGLAALAWPAAALAAPPDGDAVAPTPAARPTDARDVVPTMGYAQSAFGAARMSAGVAAYVGVLYGQPNPTGDPSAGKTMPQGGVHIFGSPVDRLTLSFDLDKRDFGTPTPSGTIAVRILGSREQGWAFGAAASYRTEGFANVAGEVEGSLLLSFAKYRLHADLNGTFGAAVKEHEMDSEVKLRLGYDVLPWMRVGADSRFRMRVGDGKFLAGGRTVDAVGGPEVVFGYKHFFAALAGGPSTVGVARGFGWGATTTLGAAAF
jgi:hypothetical protein